MDLLACAPRNGSEKNYGGPFPLGSPLSMKRMRCSLLPCLLNSSNVDGTARKGKKRGKSVLSIGNQHKLARREAEDAHSVMADRCDPTAGIELSQHSSFRLQVRPISTVL